MLLPPETTTLSIYHFDLVGPENPVDEYCCGDAFVEFTASGVAGSWGIDNVRLTPVPAFDAAASRHRPRRRGRV